MNVTSYSDPTLLDPKRTALDDELRRLCARFRDRPAGVRNSLNGDQLEVLLNFARRAAVFAMRERDAAWVADGLTAVAMADDERVDPAELPPTLGLLHHAAMFIGADAAALFAAAARQATRSVARFFRTPAFDEWQETATGFVRRGSNDYQPAHDLLRTAQDVRAILERDRYAVADIVIGTALPDELFASPPRTAGAVTLDARERGQRRHNALVFVAELGGPPHFVVSDIPHVAVAEGNLAGVVIAPFETPAALQRFAAPIRHALASSPVTPAA